MKKLIFIITLFLNLSNLSASNDYENLSYNQAEKQSDVLNQYGDKFKPTDGGYGVDISSHR